MLVAILMFVSTVCCVSNSKDYGPYQITAGAIEARNGAYRMGYGNPVVVDYGNEYAHIRYSESVVFTSSSGWKNTDFCIFRKYAAGGELTELKDIKPPQVVLNQKSLLVMLIEGGVKLAGGQNSGTSIAKVGNKAWKTSSKMISTAGGIANGMTKFLTATSKLSKVLTKAGPAALAFGAVMGILDMGAPTVAQLKEATDKAFEELTKDVNKQFKEMQGYVDQSIIDTLKEQVQKMYISRSKHFYDICPNEANKEKKFTCPHDVINDIITDLHWFMPKIPATPTFKNVKKIEVHVPSLVNVANLFATVMLNQIQTYDKATGGWDNTWTRDENADQLKSYKIYLKKYLNEIIDYVEKAVKYINDFWSRNDCADTFKCQFTKAVKEGLWLTKKHTVDRYICKCARNKYIPEETCNRDAQIRTDGKFPNGYLKERIRCTPEYKCNKEGVLQTYLKVASDAYQKVQGSKRMRVVKKYWKEQATDVIATLQDIVDVYGIDAKVEDEPAELKYLDETRHLELKAVAGILTAEYMEKLKDEMDQPAKLDAMTNEHAHGHWMYTAEDDDIPIEKLA